MHHTQIALNKDQAVMLTSLTSSGVTIYTDGSDIDGQVGVAAVLFSNGIEQAVLHQHLGTSRQHTVFEAELVGAILRMHIAMQMGSNNSITLGIDNQVMLSSRAKNSISDMTNGQV